MKLKKENKYFVNFFCEVQRKLRRHLTRTIKRKKNMEIERKESICSPDNKHAQIGTSW